MKQIQLRHLIREEVLNEVEGASGSQIRKILADKFDVDVNYGKLYIAIGVFLKQNTVAEAVRYEAQLVVKVQRVYDTLAKYGFKTKLVNVSSLTEDGGDIYVSRAIKFRNIDMLKIVISNLKDAGLSVTQIVN